MIAPVPGLRVFYHNPKTPFVMGHGQVVAPGPGQSGVVPPTHVAATVALVSTNGAMLPDPMVKLEHGVLLVATEHLHVDWLHRKHNFEVLQAYWRAEGLLGDQPGLSLEDLATWGTLLETVKDRGRIATFAPELDRLMRNPWALMVGDHTRGIQSTFPFYDPFDGSFASAPLAAEIDVRRIFREVWGGPRGRLEVDLVCIMLACRGFQPVPPPRCAVGKILVLSPAGDFTMES